MPERKGVVVAVCLSAQGGVPKHVQESVQIDASGVLGDFHAGELNSKGMPNRRQVTVVGKEALDEVGVELDISIPAGGLGENVLVQGLGNLGDLQPGQRLRFSSGAELEITAQNDPCNNLAIYHRLAVKHLYGKRGLLTVVVAPGPVAPGDAVTVA